jgi:hypothetical protein
MDEYQDRAKSFLLNHLHGPQLAEIRAEEEIIANAETGLQVAENELLREVGDQQKAAA